VPTYSIPAFNRELAELLGQVKPPTVSKDDIEKSGLEIIKASMLEEYEKQGRVANNCIDRVRVRLTKSHYNANPAFLN
jgi:hypothetical protein